MAVHSSKLLFITFKCSVKSRTLVTKPESPAELPGCSWSRYSTNAKRRSTLSIALISSAILVMFCSKTNATFFNSCVSHENYNYTRLTVELFIMHAVRPTGSHCKYPPSQLMREKLQRLSIQVRIKYELCLYLVFIRLCTARHLNTL